MLNKVVFLDRDGVININPAPGDYVKKWEEFEFLPKTKEALSLLVNNGCQIFLITNQAGVGKGLMTKEDLNFIHQNFQQELEKEGVVFKGIYYCGHHSDSDCNCRKPKPGMLIKAANDHQINLSDAVFIGDRETDKLAAEAAGCRFIMVSENKSLWDAVNSDVLGL